MRFDLHTPLCLGNIYRTSRYALPEILCIDHMKLNCLSCMDIKQLSRPALQKLSPPALQRSPSLSQCAIHYDGQSYGNRYVAYRDARAIWRIRYGSVRTRYRGIRGDGYRIRGAQDGGRHLATPWHLSPRATHRLYEDARSQSLVGQAIAARSQTISADSPAAAMRCANDVEVPRGALYLELYWLLAYDCERVEHSDDAILVDEESSLRPAMPPDILHHDAGHCARQYGPEFLKSSPTFSHRHGYGHGHGHDTKHRSR